MWWPRAARTSSSTNPRIGSPMAGRRRWSRSSMPVSKASRRPSASIFASAISAAAPPLPIAASPRFAPHFKDLNVDVMHIEFANRNMYEVELWEQYGGDKILCAGVIDVKGRSLEPVEVVADRIRTCLRHCAPDKLWVAPDCGFSQTVRFLADREDAGHGRRRRACGWS